MVHPRGAHGLRQASRRLCGLGRHARLALELLVRGGTVHWNLAAQLLLCDVGQVFDEGREVLSSLILGHSAHFGVQKLLVSLEWGDFAAITLDSEGAQGSTARGQSRLGPCIGAASGQHRINRRDRADDAQVVVHSEYKSYRQSTSYQEA